MDSLEDIKGEFVKRGKKTEKLGEPRADGYGEEDVPNEKADNRMFGDIAFFPGDFGMGNVGNNDGDSSGN